MIKIGDKAPLFLLMDTERREFTNINIEGKTTLFLFFPAAFTSTCTTELCEVRDDIARYNQLNVQVFGISTDALFTLKKYKEDQRLNFELLSDYNKEVSRAFGSLYEQFKYNMKGVSKRSAIIIDKNGIIQYCEILENASDVPNFESIHQKLTELGVV
jgi:glutaredoxin-dependent peroxiredoxin